MYDENTNERLNKEEAADEYRSESQTPNFVLKDQGQQPGQEGTGQNNQEQTYQNTASQQYQSMPGQGGHISQYQGSAGQSPQYQTPYPYQNAAGQGTRYQNGAGQGAYSQQQGAPERMYNWQNENQGPASDPKRENSGHSSKEEKKKHSGGMGRRVAGITAAAILFGTVSGGTMVGVNMLAGAFQKEEVYAQSSPTEMSTEAPTTQAYVAPFVDGGAGTALALDVSDIVEKAMPSVVAINNTMLYEGSTWFGQRQQYEVPSSGSGIIAGKIGRAHV